MRRLAVSTRQVLKPRNWITIHSVAFTVGVWERHSPTFCFSRTVCIEYKCKRQLSYFTKGESESLVYHSINKGPYFTVDSNGYNISLHCVFMVYWGRKNADILKISFSNALSSMEIVHLLSEMFFWRRGCTKIEHCFRNLWGSKQAAIHYGKHWWPNLLTQLSEKQTDTDEHANNIH